MVPYILEVAGTDSMALQQDAQGSRKRRPTGEAPLPFGELGDERRRDEPVHGKQLSAVHDMELSRIPFSRRFSQYEVRIEDMATEGADQCVHSRQLPVEKLEPGMAVAEAVDQSDKWGRADRSTDLLVSGGCDSHTVVEEKSLDDLIGNGSSGDRRCLREKVADRFPQLVTVKTRGGTRGLRKRPQRR